MINFIQNQFCKSGEKCMNAIKMEMCESNKATKYKQAGINQK